MWMTLWLVTNFHISAGAWFVQALAITRILGRALLLLVQHLSLLPSTSSAPWVRTEVVYDHRFLGGFLGGTSARDAFVLAKVDQWVSDIHHLSHIIG